MRCVVLTCNNKSSCLTQGETFFDFPKDQPLRIAWLRALGLEGWCPEADSAVCSNHFLADDLVSKGTMRGLCPGAMPIVTAQICRICFGTNCKLYRMTSYKLIYQAYETLTGLSLENESELPELLCADCARRVLNCARFRTRTLRAHLMLLDTLKTHDRVTVETLNMINGIQDPINANVTYSSNDNYDLDIEQFTQLIQEQSLSSIHPAPDLMKNTVNILSNVKIEDGTFNQDNNMFTDEDTDDEIITIKPTYLNTIYEDSTDDEDLAATTDKLCTRDDEIVTCMKKETDLRNGINKDPFVDSMILGKVLEDDKRSSVDSNAEKMTQKENSFQAGEVTEASGVDDQDQETKPQPRETEEEWEEMLVEETLKRCEICSYQTKELLQFVEHLKQHSVKSGNTFQCSKCSYRSCSRKSLAVHSRSHTEIMDRCNICSKVFKYKGRLANHMKIHNKIRVTCNLCDKKFSSSSYLALHKVRRHKVSEKESYQCFVCDLCKFIFKCKNVLTRHMTTAHSETKRSCNICGRNFDDRTSLVKHVAIEHF